MQKQHDTSVFLLAHMVLQHYAMSQSHDAAFSYRASALICVTDIDTTLTQPPTLEIHVNTHGNTSSAIWIKLRAKQGLKVADC